MLIVAPSGTMNCAMDGRTFNFSSAVWIDSGITAAELDVENVEPLTHPSDLTNRLDEDTVGESLPVEKVLGLAPSTELGFLSVPKVLGDQEDA